MLPRRKGSPTGHSARRAADARGPPESHIQAVLGCRPAGSHFAPLVKPARGTFLPFQQPWERKGDGRQDENELVMPSYGLIRSSIHGPTNITRTTTYRTYMYINSDALPPFSDLLSELKPQPRSLPLGLGLWLGHARVNAAEGLVCL